MKRPLLELRAGPRAFARLRRDGFSFDQLGAYVGSASGPRWLVLQGIDRALLDAGLLRPRRAGRLLLIGASAGAWRMLALASPDPVTALDRLSEAYIQQAFPRRVQPRVVSAAYRRMLAELFPLPIAAGIVGHPTCDVAVRIARARGLAASDARPIQLAGLIVASVLQRLSPRCLSLSFERIVLHSAPQRYAGDSPAVLARLEVGNLVDAALASGSVPLYMSAVRAIPDLPRGRYRDGGLTDYHLAGCAVAAGGEGITLLVHYQPQVLPTWFDKGRRSPGSAGARVLDDLLVIHPTAEFITSLPGGKLPDRKDFLTWAEEPQERFRRWREAQTLGEELSEELARDLASGSLPGRLRALGP